MGKCIHVNKAIYMLSENYYVPCPSILSLIFEARRGLRCVDSHLSQFGSLCGKCMMIDFDRCLRSVEEIIFGFL
jgi:hypothetical protein